MKTVAAPQNQSSSKLKLLQKKVGKSKYIGTDLMSGITTRDLLYLVKPLK